MDEYLAINLCNDPLIQSIQHFVNQYVLFIVKDNHLLNKSGKLRFLVIIIILNIQ